MLAGATHGHKVNFCKFTNETRNAIEDATARSGQTWIAAVNGTAAGGGYELALACDEIILVDDRSSAVSLPEVPLLAVLPGTGGLTRLVDKRHVRRDLADVFATRAEGVKGQQAVDWGLVDAVVPRSGFDAAVRERALARAERSARPDGGAGVTFTPLDVEGDDDSMRFGLVTVAIDRQLGVAHITVRAPGDDEPTTADGLLAAGADAWAIAAARQLDDAILRLRFNEPEIGTWVLHTEGDPAAHRRRRGAAPRRRALARQRGALLLDTGPEAPRSLGADDRRAGRAGRLLRRPARRVGARRRPLVHARWAGPRGRVRRGDAAAHRCQRRLVPDGQRVEPAGDAILGAARRELEDVRSRLGKELHAAEAVAIGLVTFTPDDLDWDDEIRLTLEERTSFSPDALTGMEANLRFAGPETMETKIFARLTAWQNWIFQRPNAVGAEGALRRFGSGSRPVYDKARV